MTPLTKKLKIVFILKTNGYSLMTNIIGGERNARIV